MIITLGFSVLRDNPWRLPRIHALIKEVDNILLENIHVFVLGHRTSNSSYALVSCKPGSSASYP